MNGDYIADKSWLKRLLNVISISLPYVAGDGLAEAMIKIMGRDLQPIYQEPRVGDIRDSLADISKARAIGYEPQYILEDGLRETIRRFESAK